VSKPEGDRTLLAAFRVKDMKLVGKWDYGKNRHIDRVRWVNDERFFMFVSLKLGRFDRRVGTPDVYASDVDGGNRIDIPNGGTYQIVDVTWDDPETVLVQRSVETAFLSKLNVDTGKVVTVATAPLRFGGFVLDSKRNVRYAVGAKEEGITQVTLRRDGENWTTVHETEMGGAVQRPLGFDREDKNVVFYLSDTGEPMRIGSMTPEGGDERTLSRNANVDPSGLLTSADDREVLAVEYDDGFPTYDFVDTEHPESKAYAGLIQAFPKHAVRFGGISRDGRYILMRAYSDIDPGAYYLFDREKGQAKFLLAAMDWIKPATMSPMQPIAVTARDGVKLHGYLTLPQGSDGKNLPLILHPHGGPHGPRDLWGFNPEVQFLANRGYAVLQINFRGSGGYGNAFEKMGYRNWGTTMINDMTDAVDWAIAEGIADKDRLCTYGASYGGYAALQSVVRNPTKYACTIGYVGVYSLPLMFEDGDIPQSMPKRTDIKSHPDHRRRPDRHRPGLRVRLFRRPGLQGAARRGLPRHPGELEPGHDHDRPRPGGRDLYRADHAGDRREDHRQGAPDALLPTMGGQTALNCALELARHDGVLEKYGVELIGAKAEAIAWPRTASCSATRWPRSASKAPLAIAHSMEEARAALDSVGLPAIIRPSFTLGGTGGGIAYNREEFERSSRAAWMPRPPPRCWSRNPCSAGRSSRWRWSATSADNCIIVCSIENFDPMGVHTGDSITVAPALTLTDKEYQ
jgi:dipeptidyl aminopeptidase/acylaminoacyl peptidase